MIRTMAKIMAETNAATAAAKLDLDSVHAWVRPAHAINITDAKEKLQSLRIEYRDRVFAKAMAFFPSGEPDKVAQFALLAKELGNVFVVDADQMYRELAAKIEPTLGPHREFTVEQKMRLSIEVRDLALTAGVKLAHTSAISIGDTFITKDTEALVDYVYFLVTDAFGHTLNTIYSEQRLIDEALARKFEGNVLAAVVMNAQTEAKPSLAQSYATKVDVDIGPDDEITDVYVLQAFEMGKKTRQKRRP